MEGTGCKIYHPELEETTTEAVSIFADNLRHSDKEIRISTLKILCYYTSLGGENSLMDEPTEKRRRIEISPASNADCAGNNVCIFYILWYYLFFFSKHKL